jgi:DNA-binding response OmpR family regulator
MSHGTQPTVLLIESDPSLRRLITLGLQHRGMCVITADSLNNLPSFEARSISLLILDVDGGVHSNWSLLTAVQAHSSLSTLPIVTLAWECPPIPVPAGLTDQPQDALSTSVSCLRKPFDARILHTTIEELLLATPTSEMTPLPASPLPVQAKTTAPSIWPVITAAGLLLAFIGLMGFLALTLVGLSIVVISLLLWTLGATSGRRSAPVPISS